MGLLLCSLILLFGWRLILTGILSICLNLIWNRFKLRPYPWDHFKKDWCGLLQGIFKCHSDAWWLVMCFDILLCCQTIYRCKGKCIYLLMLKNKCPDTSNENTALSSCQDVSLPGRWHEEWSVFKNYGHAVEYECMKEPVLWKFFLITLAILKAT